MILANLFLNWNNLTATRKQRPYFGTYLHKVANSAGLNHVKSKGNFFVPVFCVISRLIKWVDQTKKKKNMP